MTDSNETCLIVQEEDEIQIEKPGPSCLKSKVDSDEEAEVETILTKTVESAKREMVDITKKEVGNITKMDEINIIKEEILDDTKKEMVDIAKNEVLSNTKKEKDVSTNEDMMNNFVEKINNSVKELNNASREEMNNASREEMNKASREETNNASREEMNNASREETNNASREEINNASRDEINNASKEEINNVSRDEINKASKEEINKIKKILDDTKTEEKDISEKEMINNNEKELVSNTEEMINNALETVVDFTTKRVLYNIKEEEIDDNNKEEMSVGTKEEVISEVSNENSKEKEENSSAIKATLLALPETPQKNFEVFEKLTKEEDITYPEISVVCEIKKVSDSFSEKTAMASNILEAQNENNSMSLCVDKEILPNPIIKKIISLPDGFTDSSHSSSSELQSSAAPFESSSSSQENNFNSARIDFDNAIESSEIWMETNDSAAVEMPIKCTIALPLDDKIPAKPEIPIITIDENSEPSVQAIEILSVSKAEPLFSEPGFPSSSEIKEEPITIDNQSEIKIEDELKQLPTPEPVPIILPTPRKRGRPRKQVLPNPSPIVESWGPNVQEFSSLKPSKEGKRSARAERRQAKKKKFEEEKDMQDGEEDTSKRRFNLKPPIKKKKRRSTYTPKKKLPPPKKKHTELENIQNFEEETRMSASETPAGFSSRSGAIGDESQGSSVTTEGHTKSSINKKGRMEVGTDGCKPVTVQQIVEYFWPPPSSLPHGEKPEGLMIQEQITEYLGVKSFKRKYPSIKRRPVDMEERNYLQENGYVSENMCDLGLTAVFSADIIEIMYNDFPHKFEEYRKYTREKKAKEQRALREKQAAERADMDPKKEAVESAHSWNTEFNKTRRLVNISSAVFFS